MKTGKYLLALVIFWQFAFASNVELKNPKIAENLDRTKAFNFTAKQITYDTQKRITIAKGFVKINQGETYITANMLIIDNENDIVVAKGHVRYKEPNQNLILAEQIEILGKLKTTILKKANGYLNNDMKIYAKKLENHNDKKVAFSAAITTCSICNQKPTWLLSSSETVWFEKQNYFFAYNSFLKFKNIPVFWLPVVAASTKYERTMGFLTPSFTQSNLLGYGLKNTFFIPFGENQNFEITHNYFSKESDFLGVKYQLGGKNQEMRLNIGTSTEGESKNYINMNYKLNLNKHFRLKTTYQDLPFASFSRYYDFSIIRNEERFLKKSVALEGFYNHFYTNLSVENFASTEIDDLSNSSTKLEFYNRLILPLADVARLEVSQITSSFTDSQDNFDTNSTILRNVIDINLNKQLYSFIGDLYLNMNLRNVIYRDFEEEQTSYYNGENINVSWSLPFMRVLGDTTQVLRPILQINTAKTQKDFLDNAYDIDSMEDFNLDNILFGYYYSGYDTYLDGTNVNAGLMLTSKSLSFSYSLAMLGTKNIVKNTSGLILNANFLNSYAMASFTTQYESNSGNFIKTDFKTQIGKQNYFFLRYFYDLSGEVAIEPEITLAFNLQISKNFSTFIRGTVSLDDQNIFNAQYFWKEERVGIKWENSCFYVITSVSRDLYEYANVEGKLSYSIMFYFKGLGKFGN